MLQCWLLVLVIEAVAVAVDAATNNIKQTNKQKSMNLSNMIGQTEASTAKSNVTSASQTAILNKHLSEKKKNSTQFNSIAKQLIVINKTKQKYSK